MSEILELLRQRAEAGTPPEAAVETVDLDDIRTLLEEAGRFDHAGEEIPSSARARSAKRTYVAALRPISSVQRVFNTDVRAAVAALVDLVEILADDDTDLDADFAEVRTAIDRLNTSVATMDVALDQLAESLRRVQAAVPVPPDAASSPGEGLGERLAAIEARVEVLEESAEQPSGGGADRPSSLRPPPDTPGVATTRSEP